MKFKRGERGEEWDQKPGIMPQGALDCFADILKDHKGISFKREDLSHMIMWADPFWAQFFFTKKEALGVMADPKKLFEILPNLPLAHKRKMLNASLTDISHLRACELNKITSMKHRISKKTGMRFTSNNKGIGDLDSATLETVACSLYRILNWNRGQLDDWHNHVEKFNEQCQNKKLKSNLNSHSKVAYHRERLNKLADKMGIEAGLLESSEE